MCCAPGKWLAALALAAALLAACATPRSAPARLRLGADDTTAALADDLLAAYELAFPGATVSLTATSRDVAIGALDAGELDAVLLVFPPTRDDLFHTPVGRLPYALVTHPDVPTRDLTPRDARALFSGQTTRWDGDGPGVQIVAQEQATSSRLALESFVLGAQPLTPLARLAADDTHAVELVAAQPGAVSLVALGAVSDDTTIAAIDGVTPSWDAARANRYPFVAYVEYVSVGEPENGQRAFLDWLLDADGQQALAGHALPLRRADR